MRHPAPSRGHPRRAHRAGPALHLQRGHGLSRWRSRSDSPRAHHHALLLHLHYCGRIALHLGLCTRSRPAPGARMGRRRHPPRHSHHGARAHHRRADAPGTHKSRLVVGIPRLCICGRHLAGRLVWYPHRHLHVPPAAGSQRRSVDYGANGGLGGEYCGAPMDHIRDGALLHADYAACDGCQHELCNCRLRRFHGHERHLVRSTCSQR